VTNVLTRQQLQEGRSVLFSVSYDFVATSSVTVHTFTISKAVGHLHIS